MNQSRTRRGRIMLVAVDAASAVPLYEQVYSTIRMQIIDGSLRADAHLPSTRQLAADLGIARSTVVQAYEQLRAEGYITGVKGAGTRVNPQPPRLTRVDNAPGNAGMAATPHGRISGRAASIITAEMRRYPGANRSPRAFRAGVPATELMPVDLWSRLLTRRWARTTARQLAYGDPMGFEPLRSAIAGYLSAARGVRCTSARIMIVSGAQQAIDLCARVLLDAGDRVWLEDPGYHGARGAFLSAGAHVEYIPVDSRGLVVQTARETAPDARLCYVTPSRQLPTCVELSPERRCELLEWARKSGSWIIEDDYDSESRFASKPLPSLQGQDTHDCVVYIGTFSKVMFPALRIGYMVLPDALVDVFAAARHYMDVQSPFLEQATMADFIEQGHFERHIRRTQTLYRARRDVLMDESRSELSGALQVDPADSGMSVVGWLTEHDDFAVSRAAERQGVDAVALSHFSTLHLAPSGLLLGYAGVTEMDIRLGIQSLARAISGLRAG